MYVLRYFLYLKKELSNDIGVGSCVVLEWYNLVVEFGVVRIKCRFWL